MLDIILKKYSCLNTNTGLLILRIGVALIFIISGGIKVLQMSQTVEMFSQMQVPALLVYLLVIVELGGGIAILVGAWTRFVALLLSIVMIIAVIMTRQNIGMMMMPLLVLFTTLTLLCTGGGKYSIMRLCKCGSCGTCKESTMCKGGGCATISKGCPCTGACACEGNKKEITEKVSIDQESTS